MAFVNASTQFGNIAGSYACPFLFHRASVADATVVAHGQIRMAKIMGSDLQSLLRDLHFSQRALHSNVLYLQASSCQPEQTNGEAGILRRQEYRL